MADQPDTSPTDAHDPGRAESPSIHLVETLRPPIPGTLAWAAAGSLDLPRIRLTWSRRQVVSDLANISGPWAVVLESDDGWVVAADPVGVMPVYWARVGRETIAVSAYVAVLADHPEIGDALDYEGIVMSEGLGCRDETVLHRTRFAAISAVPPGHALIVNRGGSTRVVRYFDPRQLPGPDEGMTLNDCAEALRAEVDAAVRRNIADSTAVGAHVSGGLDCTAVACRADEVLAETGTRLLAGYSWAPTEEALPIVEGDERSLVKLVAARGIPISYVTHDDSGHWFDQRDPNRYPQSTHLFERWVLPAARQDGVQVMLSGWGGDELASFNGRNVASYLARRGHWVRLWRENSRRAAALGTGSAKLPLRPFAGTLARTFTPALADLWDREAVRRIAQRDAEIDARLREAFPEVADIRRRRAEAFRSARTPRDYQLLLLTDGHLSHRTSGWHQTGRIFGVDYRYPLLDIPVVRLALRMPWWAFRSEGWSRIAFRKAVEPWLPAAVVWNAAKVEPALTTPRRKSVASRRPDPFPIDDARLWDALRLGDETWRTGRRPIVGGIRPRVPATPAPRIGEDHR